MWFKLDKIFETETDRTFDVAHKLYEAGNAQGAIRGFEDALRLSFRDYGEDHTETLAIRKVLARVFRETGEDNLQEEALLHLKETLEAQRRTLGPRHAETLDTMELLGGILYDQDKFKEAKYYQSRAVEGLKRTLGAEHDNTLNKRARRALLHSRRNGRARRGPAPRLFCLPKHAQTLPTRRRRSP